MPAHDPQNKDRDFTIIGPNVEFHNVMFIPGRGAAGVYGGEYHKPTDDKGFTLKFRWHGNTRTWVIEGYKLPYVAASHTDELTIVKSFDRGLPQGQGDTLIRFLEWIEALVHGSNHNPNDESNPEEVQEEVIT